MGGNQQANFLQIRWGKYRKKPWTSVWKVESTNYCTFARICKSEFDHRCKDIIDDMVDEIPNYSDSLIDYKVSVLSQIPWLTEDTISSFMDSEQIEDILRLI